MTACPLDWYAGVWLVDFEFHQPAGERPEPLCMVAREFRSGRTLRLWGDELRCLPTAPFDTTADSLFVAYFASAELSCFLALGWPMPARILDLCIEFRRHTSGVNLPVGGRTLLGALVHYKLDGIGAAEKEGLRQLAIRGGPYTAEERRALIDYCESDVVALADLLPAMLPDIDIERALLRGRYMAAVAQMERMGVPIDVPTHRSLRERWGTLQDRLIVRIDADYGVYEGRIFKMDRFAAWLAQHRIPWPLLPSGKPMLDDNTFRDMAKSHPVVEPLRELRHSLSELRLESLAVGRDGRNRCMLSPFGSRTGRNQPSNAQFIFGPSVWNRGLIKPEPGRAISYIDYEQQEFGIAAALSGDTAMMRAYGSGDPYLAFAKQAGAVPETATKETHKKVRDQFKVCALAVQYGMGETSLAQKLDVPVARARDLLQLHRQTYPAFWRWSQSAVDHAMLHGHLQTVFGWRVQVGTDANPRSLANFPMQGNGAEILRLACSMITEAGIAVCAPVHDAVLVETAADEIEAVVVQCKRMMAEASAIILNGFALRSEEVVIRYPDRYMDTRGKKMWDTVMGILREDEEGPSGSTLSL